MAEKAQTEQKLTLEKFEQAYEIVKKVTKPTGLIESEFFSQSCGNKVYLKPENMQVTGAYKIRGAYYKRVSGSKCGVTDRVRWHDGTECIRAGKTVQLRDRDQRYYHYEAGRNSEGRYCDCNPVRTQCSGQIHWYRRADRRSAEV